MRRLLLLAIAVILGAVGATYYYQKARVARQAPAKPQPIPAGLDSIATGWKWSNTERSDAIVEIEATDARELADPPRFEIENVTLRVYHKKNNTFDLIKSAKAQFEKEKNTLYSEGDVEIRMGLPSDGSPPAGHTTVIRTSGVTFDTTTGKASTPRPAAFEFERGNGKSVGASYDPSARVLELQSQAELNWRAQSPKAKPMKLEAGQLIYRENDGLVAAVPWARLTRENEVVESADALVTLDKGAVKQVVAERAKGAARYPDRRLEFGGDHSIVDFNDEGQVASVSGEGNAHVVSTTAVSRTKLDSHRVDLRFEAFRGEAALKTAYASGNGVMESAPVPKPGVLPQDTRKLRSESIQMEMRPGGKEVESVVTHAPGTLEFIPNRPGPRRRQLDGERLWINYGADNRIQSFRATKVATVTDPPPSPPAKNGAKPQPRPRTRTWSREMDAEFDPKTGQMNRLRQTGDFRYEEGPRKAQSDSAELDERAQVVSLSKAARVWDDSGTTSADRIVIDQKNDEVNADGNVVSTRMPDRKGGSSSPMLSKEEPYQATAARMRTREKNQQIRYEGNALLWQGANRIRGEVIDIDRAGRVLTARGAVRTQVIDSGTPPAQKSAAPQFVTVDAPQLLYTEKERVARYTGGAHLVRPGLDARGDEIRTLLKESKGDSASSLEKAFVDGQAVVIRSEPGRTLKGTADHADYDPGEGRFTLHGGDPVLADSRTGVTRGREIVFYVNDDRLVVNGTEQKPVITRIKKK